MRQRGLIIASLLGMAILIGLGSWQLYRLQWKNELIERIGASARAKPVTMADVEAGGEHGYDVDWLRVRTNGYYRHDLERHVYTLRKGQAGWRIVTPLVMPGEHIVFVDRGFVPRDKKQPSSRAGSQPGTKLPVTLTESNRKNWPEADTVTGVVRLRSDTKPAFSPDNEPDRNTWYWFDLPALAASLPDDLGAVPPNGVARIMPFVLQLEPGGEAQASGPLPIVDPVKPELRNRHLGYALTWFGLAGALAAVSFHFWRSRRKGL